MSMSATPTMVVVLKSAITVKEASLVAATVASQLWVATHART